MIAQEVLAKVLEAGGQVIAGPDRPRLLVPRPLKPLVVEYQEAIRQIVLSGIQGAGPAPRRDSPTFSRTVTRLLGMRLDSFAWEGAPLEIRVPWLEVTLWFVPGEADAEALAREGISRGRIWTARELMDLLAIPGLTPAQTQTVARAKLEFAGEVLEVRSRRRGEVEAP